MNIIMNDLIELMDPRYIEVWANSRQEAESPLTRIQTTADREQNMKITEHRMMNHDMYPETIDNR